MSAIPSYSNLWVPTATSAQLGGRTVVNFTSNAALTDKAKSDRLKQFTGQDKAGNVGRRDHTVKRNAIIAVVAGALVVILVWYFAFYKPKSDDVSSTQGEVAAAQPEQQDLEASLARLRSLDKERPQQQATLDKLNAAIPDSPDLADFIFQANTAAADSGVDWVSIAPDAAGREHRRVVRA